MKRIDLTKYGFVRSADEDFSDDGARFTCYRMDRILVTKNLYLGNVYISARIDDGILPYEIYSELEHYKNCDVLNWIPVEELTDEMLIKFALDCKQYLKEYNEAERKYINELPSEEEIRYYYKKMDEHYRNEYEEAKKYFDIDTLIDAGKDASYIVETLVELKKRSTLLNLNVEHYVANAIKDDSTRAYLKIQMKNEAELIHSYEYDCIMQYIQKRK